MGDDQLSLWPGEAGDGLRWSLTRRRRLTDCPRKYYLFHYASRGGHASDASPEVRELFVLKGLQSRHMWVGSVVHDLVEAAMAAWRDGGEIFLEELVERGTRVMRAQYTESSQGAYRQRPRQAVGLLEHEYGHDVSRESWAELRDHMERCLRNFFGLDTVARIRDAPRWRWLAVETLGSFELAGATIVVRPDFALREDDGRVLMLDWKTGHRRPASEKLQLSVYGLFAQRSWGLGHDHLLGKVVYLVDGTEQDFVLEESDLDDAERVIRESVETMRALAGEGTPSRDSFAMTEDRETCERCPFRRPCGR